MKKRKKTENWDQEAGQWPGFIFVICFYTRAYNWWLRSSSAQSPNPHPAVIFCSFICLLLARSVLPASEQHCIVPRSVPTSSFLGGFLEARYHTDCKDLVGSSPQFLLNATQPHKYYVQRSHIHPPSLLCTLLQELALILILLLDLRFIARRWTSWGMTCDWGLWTEINGFYPRTCPQYSI